jgi:hypothetical protein
VINYHNQLLTTEGQSTWIGRLFLAAPQISAGVFFVGLTTLIAAAGSDDFIGALGGRLGCILISFNGGLRKYNVW